MARIGPTSDVYPIVISGSGAVSVKGEDTFCIHEGNDYNLFAVFDGHNGADAANICRESLPSCIDTLLHGIPRGNHSYHTRIQLAQAAVDACKLLDGLLSGIASGCTATLVLQVGWLLTVANVGDSICSFDNGQRTTTLTPTHRVNHNEEERARLMQAGAVVARIASDMSGPAPDSEFGVGPLRVWPGGLSLSRALGDSNVGSFILYHPNVHQVLVPRRGGRLILATDGLWDAYPTHSASSMVRSLDADAAALGLCRAAARCTDHADDVTTVVVDILPPGLTSFVQLAEQLTGQQTTSVGWGGSKAPLGTATSWANQESYTKEGGVMDQGQPGEGRRKKGMQGRPAICCFRNGMQGAAAGVGGAELVEQDEHGLVVLDSYDAFYREQQQAQQQRAQQQRAQQQLSLSFSGYGSTLQPLQQQQQHPNSWLPQQQPLPYPQQQLQVPPQWQQQQPDVGVYEDENANGNTETGTELSGGSSGRMVLGQKKPSLTGGKLKLHHIHANA